MGIRVASFFFSRGRGDLGHADRFFTSLAAQLARMLPELKPYISKAIRQNLDIAERGLAEQWKILIFQPLSMLSGTSKIIFVIDALDECDGEDDIRLILQRLTELSKLTTAPTRVFSLRYAAIVVIKFLTALYAASFQSACPAMHALPLPSDVPPREA